MLIVLAVFAAGCTKTNPDAHFFQGQLNVTEKGPNEQVTTVAVLLERDFVASENKIVETYDDVVRGARVHSTTVYDFNTGSIEVQENKQTVAKGTFSCQRSGAGFETLTSCTCDVKTTQGDQIHGEETYEGTQKLSINDTEQHVKNNAKVTLVGDLQAVPEEEFRRLLKGIPSGGCQIGRADSTPRRGGVLAAMLLPAVILSRRRMRGPRRRR